MIQEIEIKVQSLTEDELNQKLESAQENLPLEFGENGPEELSNELVRKYFGYYVMANASGDIGLGARVFDQMQVVVDRNFEQAGPDELEEAMEYYSTWRLTAMKFVEEDNASFRCMPLYRQILEGFSRFEDEFQVRKVKVMLQLAHHFKFWLASGGDIDELEEADKELLVDTHDNYIDKLEKILEAEGEKGNWDNVIESERALFSYFKHGKKPNDAIKWLKSLISHLPKSESYTTADKGYFQMALATVYKEYKKWKTAKKYFERARETYLKTGPENEDLAKQAGWLAEECAEML